MKRSLLLTVALICTASLAFGAAGTVGLFSDNTGVDCNIVDAAPGLLSVYVVHILTDGSTAIEYAAPVPDCFLASTGSYLSDTQVFPVNIGNSQTGISTAYGACLVSPIHVLTINLFAAGLTAPCCQWDVVPHPINGLNATDCTMPTPVKVPASGTFATINGSNPPCPCGTPTESSTWGGIKSLYGQN